VFSKDPLVSPLVSDYIGHSVRHNVFAMSYVLKGSIFPSLLWMLNLIQSERGTCFSFHLNSLFAKNVYVTMKLTVESVRPRFQS
jgi:hypothetical protein